MASILDQSEGSGASFVFEYDINLEDAPDQQPLPEGVKYTGTVEDVRSGLNQLTGEPQVILRIVIPPEEFPADFPADHWPDGVRLTYYSPSLGNSISGKANAKHFARALRLPTGNRLRGEDIQGKRVQVEINHNQMDDGRTQMRVRGMPTAA